MMSAALKGPPYSRSFNGPSYGSQGIPKEPNRLVEPLTFE